MENSAVTYMAVFFDNSIHAGKTVQHARILNVAALLQDHAPEITTQRCVRSYVAARTNDNVADQNGGRVQKCARINHGHNAINGKNLSHAALNMSARLRHSEPIRDEC